MGKARTAFYSVKGDALTRTHAFCPKCGPGVVLAAHASPSPRRSCGKCGYSEADTAPAPKPEKPARGKGGPKGERAPAPAPRAST
ncbi:MAG: 30S ribosomal protein S27ae [Euryarchaeota archaeon]|nr:30S ribosomal protein S27ae [Euryarchaeota archaeon]MDE1837032.1 30S ribosomal protein S27ae [Euryarchaeota archaeon]MDE1879882.1 30S ribosomal protein S27ae [Euryarchaeota archaeon]MDE2045690.1 30S ribosomal protein S27ae [Thermoplasmata archaeon]